MSLPAPDTPTRNRAASTSDSGLPQHEHKRPRLSDVQGDPPNVVPSVMTTQAKVVADSPDSQNALMVDTNRPELDLNTHPRPNTPTETGTLASPNSSKVTINTRPLSSQSSNHARTASISTKMNSDTSSKSPSRSSTTTADHATTGTAVDQDEKQPDTISISSSENDSPPPIEVAVPEDFDQDPSDTQWEPVSTSSAVRRLSLGPSFVHRTFPYANTLEPGFAHKVINIFASAFMHGKPGDGPLFNQVNAWLQDLVRQASQLDRATVDAEYEFWETFPHIAMDLLKREVAPSAEVEVSDLIDFFVGFVRLTKLIADVETSRFRSYPDNVDGKLIRPSITHSYIQTCHWFFATDSIPLYHVLAATLGVGSLQVVDGIAEGVLAAGLAQFVDSMADLFDAMSVLLPRKVVLVDQAMNVLQQTGVIAKSCTLRYEADHDRSEDKFAVVRHSLIRFLEKANSALDHAIVKQAPWLTIENSDAILTYYKSFISNLTTSFPEASCIIVASAGVDPNDFTSTELATLAVLSWRFSTLCRFIKNGRMELRVRGIGAMADELVKIYNEFINSPRCDRSHPKVRFMVHFIRKSELIRYIIGVDSHPQILNRSQNIVGFLCVSHTYTNDDTDIIWKTAMECQDPRAGAEVLRVLYTNFEHLDPRFLNYITGKVLDLPFSRINPAIMEFVFRLLYSAYLKLSNAPGHSIDAVDLNICTTRLCLNLLREANAVHHCASDFAARIRQVVSEQIMHRLELTRNGSENAVPPEDWRNMIMELCIDLESHTAFACGSVYAIGLVLRSLDIHAATILIHEHSLAKLVIDDLVHLSTPADVRNANRSHWTDYDCYLTTLPQLILHAPDCFGEDLMDQLWINLLSSQQIQTEIRSKTWTALAGVLEQAQVSNEVLDTFISKYLPQLSPHEFDKSVLNFAQQSVRYESRIASLKIVQADEVITIPGIERVWTIMLESTPNTVEVAASDFIIQEYLDSTVVLSSPLSSAMATHLALIDRCVQQVIDAAHHIKLNHNSTPQTNEPCTPIQSLKFHRSLHFLRRFLETLKTRPRFSTLNRIDIEQRLKSFDVKGETIDVKLQVHGHPSLSNQITNWTVGLDNTASEIWSTISSVTGWSQFTVIYRGGRAEYKDNESTLADLGCTAGLLMVSKTPGASNSIPDRSVRGSSPVDNKVMNHFDDLYSLLDLDNEFAKEVYSFLTMFSSQEYTLSKLRAMSTSAHDLLPVEKPYKLMYYLRALRSCIEDESFNAQPDTDFLVYSVRTVIQTLNTVDDLKADHTLRLTIIHGLMEALLLAFRAKVSEQVSKSYVVDHSSFLKHILGLWSEIQSVDQVTAGVPPIQALIKLPFEVLSEAVLHDETIWQALPQDAFTDLLLHALLRHPILEVRQAILDVIYSVAGNGPVKSYAKTPDVRAPHSRFSSAVIDTCLGRLWDMLVTFIPTACDSPQTCLEFFDSCTSILKVIGKNHDENRLRGFIHDWKTLLMQHRHQQNIGFAQQDFTIFSLGKLLLESLKLNPAVAQQMSNSDSYGRDLFLKFLFPPLSEDDSVLVPCDTPVLDTQTRQVLYNLILAVSSTTSGMETMVGELNKDLVPKDYYFSPLLSNDRQALRSDVGYAGLKNLSNTCYLNSLLSQLFMNVEFRDLIMNINIVDEAKQKLVIELSKVFAHMQNSYEESISPECAVDAITQWDGEQIDVTVQMDVDEFFNLLFDRIEFQILDREARHHFKSIYGGQLVQQIKSKECEHVSETLEPFSAVQVEIRGKSGLEESLRAYVEGEVLQGENKYSCTGCGKHVDAVKRACLKDVPDHLIFNLKRFDYDIMTGMRCKVNDEFHFPVSIDMGPYQLEALSNPNMNAKPDLFELTGIIVHSGTAESGHYYSYIRKRPAAAAREESWVQFNDQDVTKFDPATIGDCCFGGFDYNTLSCQKFYSGYMLFYQRSSSLEAFGQRYSQHNTMSPTRLSFSQEMEHNIAQQNELYLRSFVAQDPVHAKFVKSLLHQLPVANGGKCSSEHVLEAQTVTMALDYINSVSARWKELPEVDGSLKLLEAFATRCYDCALEVIKWSIKDTNLGDNIVRCCYPAVRKAFSHLVGICWQALAEHGSRSCVDQSNVDQDTILQYDVLLEDFVKTMLENWDIILRHGRAWEQYFGVLSALTKLGGAEAQTIVDQGFLERTLELVHLHVPSANAVKRLKPRYQTYLTFKERNRPYGHHSLIQFLADLLPHVALDAPINQNGLRVQSDEKIGLTPEEVILFELGRPNQMQWLKKIILGGHNLPATDTMVAYVAKFATLNGQLCECLKEALLRERQIFNAVSFLRPSLVFIAHAVSEDSVISLVEAALESIGTTGGQYGKEYLAFLSHLLASENNEIPFSQGALQDLMLQAIKVWAPVLLMQPNDIHSDGRGDTLDFLREILFTPLENARANSNTGKYQLLKQHVTALLDACAAYAQRTFLDPPQKEAGMELQAGQANHVIQVVESYLPFLMATAGDEEKANRISGVMDELKVKSDNLVDDMTSASEWKASSDFEALSDADLSEAST